MRYCILLLSLLIVVITEANIYSDTYFEHPDDADDQAVEALFYKVIDQMEKELVDTADTYLEYPEKVKELPIELPADYDGMDTLNPNPSIRDQEYLQHSTLWSHQRNNNNNNNNNNNKNKSNDRHRIQPTGLKGIKDEKAENPLPAYCTPPNPCPVGYTSENNCLTNFENVATFSRDFQNAQDCMCDTEHMLECSGDTGNSNSLSNVQISDSDFDEIVEQFQEENPFFRGEKLPIAAKKGIHVID
ncbi:Neuroendocrine protein 7B2 [Camponotus floridanus]|uniref:Neuroendocrine protein 7B2 n=1 Tax=Camponotus floridanus TaxID=104421 RepID=E2AEA2_CAMFO|nr:Neuroendocrine protein 7B2 [Camponotus floridanus]